jgi:hypothetical protein
MLAWVLVGIMSLAAWQGMDEAKKDDMVRSLFNLYVTEERPSCNEGIIHVFEEEETERALFYAECTEWLV